MRKKIDSRQRLEAALNHKPVDRVCCDLGGTAVTGMAASAVSRLRKAVIGEPEYRVPAQMIENKVFAKIPENATACFLAMEDDSGIFVSSPHEDLISV